MHIDILTIFPDMFTSPFAETIIRRACDAGHLQICCHNIRDYSTDKHRRVDDAPYGGGAGMVMKPEPLVAAIEDVVLGGDPRCLRVLLTPQGRPLTQAVAQQLAEWPRLLLVCGRYEGVDERVREGWIDEEISIGDYVLSGGEIPAMVLVDAVTRLLPGVLGNPASIAEESHSASLLEYPQYTRPEAFRGQQVPEVLQSGDHGAIAQWRAEQSHKRTLDRRPDLVDRPPLRENKE